MFWQNGNEERNQPHFCLKLLRYTWKRNLSGIWNEGPQWPCDGTCCDKEPDLVSDVWLLTNLPPLSFSLLPSEQGNQKARVTFGPGRNSDHAHPCHTQEPSLKPQLLVKMRTEPVSSPDLLKPCLDQAEDLPSSSQKALLHTKPFHLILMVCGAISLGIRI